MSCVRLCLSKKLGEREKAESLLNFPILPGGVCGGAERLFAVENPISRAKTGKSSNVTGACFPVHQLVKTF